MKANKTIIALAGAALLALTISSCENKELGMPALFPQNLHLNINWTPDCFPDASVPGTAAPAGETAPARVNSFIVTVLNEKGSQVYIKDQTVWDGSNPNWKEHLAKIFTDSKGREHFLGKYSAIVTTMYMGDTSSTAWSKKIGWPEKFETEYESYFPNDSTCICPVSYYDSFYYGRTDGIKCGNIVENTTREADVTVSPVTCRQLIASVNQEIDAFNSGITYCQNSVFVSGMHPTYDLGKQQVGDPILLYLGKTNLWDVSDPAGYYPEVSLLNVPMREPYNYVFDRAADCKNIKATLFTTLSTGGGKTEADLSGTFIFWKTVDVTDIVKGVLTDLEKNPANANMAIEFEIPGFKITWEDINGEMEKVRDVTGGWKKDVKWPVVIAK